MKHSTKTKMMNTMLKTTTLSTAVALAMTALTSTAYAADYKKIGDLEIYKAAEENKVSIMMMIDTSGSMSENVVRDRSACDVPSDVNYQYEPVVSQSTTTPSYRRVGCQPVSRQETKRVYFLVSAFFGKPAVGGDGWKDAIETCLDEACTTSRGLAYFPGNYSDYKVEAAPDSRRNGNGAYKNPRYLSKVFKAADSGDIAYDRLTRLKDAVFELMDSQELDPNKVSIGLGQYSSATPAADGRTGRIVVPVAPLDATQRQKIKTAVAALIGSGGTPSANAYAETGAYMLGTNTVKIVGGVEIENGFSKSVAESKNGSNYISPLRTGTVAECDSQGIYFLTDGYPNSSSTPSILMKQALGSKSGSFGSYTAGVDTLLNGGSSGNGWPEIGVFARNLRIANDNPAGVSIRTAVVGFGSVFDTSKIANLKQTLKVPVLDQDTSMPIAGQFKNKTATYFNCELITEVDAKNACNWGAKSHPSLPNVGGYGEGGFYSAQSTEDVVNSVKQFLGDLNNEISNSPSGTVSIPKDPMNANSIQPYAYLPMVQPEVAKNYNTWEGNLKKYNTLYGTLYGKNAAGSNVRLYVTDPTATASNGNYPMALNIDAMDLWQTTAETNNSTLTAGGSRSRLLMPSTTNKANIRTVYVESTVNGKKTLVKVGTDGTNLIGFDQLDATEYDIIDRAYILNYLGFAVSTDAATYTGSSLAANTQILKNQLASATLNTKPMLGGVLHSVPVLASYSGLLDNDTGNITSNESKRSDYLLYGSMDGALHMVEARTGDEKFSFIPKAVFDDEDQRGALKVDSTYSQIGSPKFGVDAPWATDATYDYKTIGSGSSAVTKMTASRMYAYGGLRMGGVGFYGLDISDKDNPTMMFSINSSTAGFERLGQTWSKPLTATIKTGSNLTDTKDVLFIGGGYDMCYENPAFKLNDTTNTDSNCVGKTQAQGNAVYMIDAKTGARLQTWTYKASSTQGDRYMNHSIVSEIVGLDRNSNGYVDSLYFGDLGGQVFRIDLQEGVSASSNNLTRRVVRVFSANESGDSTLASGHINYRFYEKPEVSFYDYDNSRIAVVNIASGDRSSPAHKNRTLADANRIYGIIDRDLATAKISSASGLTGLTTVNLTHANLQHYDTAAIATGSNAYRLRLIDNLKNGTKQGWYYTMNRFDGRAGIKNLKSVGAGAVLGSIYYASIYSPEYNYTNAQSCSAKILGGTERQLYCLPWGICATSDGGLVSGSSNGTLGYMKAGPGIQELALTTVTNTAGQSSNATAILSPQTILEQQNSATSGYGNSGPGNPFTGAETTGTSGTSSGADKIASNVMVSTDRVLKVKRWYDLQTAEASQ